MKTRLLINKMKKHLHIFLTEIGVPLCQMGYCFKLGKYQRTPTLYADEERNWVFSCDECFEVIEEYYKERWVEWRNGAL
jgi:hypothetical protein